MSTAAESGKAGVVNIGGVIAEVTGWNMSRPVVALEATSMSSGGNQEFVAGLAGWSGTFTAEVFANKTGAQTAATFQVGAAAAANTPTFSGSIIITDEPIAVDVAGVVNYAYTFQGTGVCAVAVA